MKPAFKKCGKNFQIASGVKIGWTSSVEIGNDVFIANYCWIQGKGRVVLEDEVMIGPFTCLASNRHGRTGHSWRYGIGSCAPIVLKKGSWTGAHVVVTAGVTIGEGAVVAAGAVVTSDILSDTVSGGVPAKVIKSLT